MNNFDDLNLRIKILENRAEIHEHFTVQLLKTLLANKKISSSEVTSVIHSIEADYPYIKEQATHENTALSYFCNTIFTEIPELTTLEYKRYHK